MSVESPSLHNGVEYRALPYATTEKGTEVQSRTGNRIVDTAHRVANFLDRLKSKRVNFGEKVSDMGESIAEGMVSIGTDVGEGLTGLVEAGQDKISQGKEFIKGVGRRAAGAVIATGELAVGAAIIGGRKAGEKIESGAIAVTEGIDKAADYTRNEIDGMKEALKDRAERAKVRREERRARWAERWNNTKEKFGDMAEKNKRRARAARMAGRAALSTYKANVDTPNTGSNA